MKKGIHKFNRSIYMVVASAVMLFVSLSGLAFAWYYISKEIPPITITARNFDAEIYVNDKNVEETVKIEMHFQTCTFLPDGSEPDFRAEEFNSACKTVNVRIVNTGIAMVKTFIKITPEFTVTGDTPPILYSVFSPLEDWELEEMAENDYYTRLIYGFMNTGFPTGFLPDDKPFESAEDLTRYNQMKILNEYNRLFAERSLLIEPEMEGEVTIVFWADFYGLVAHGFTVGGYMSIAPFDFTVTVMAVDENFQAEA